ncbi:MAG: cytidylate kinase-like family protein, partial [Candidatus Riflebacteria bacterium]|nr:cytidylate kinase-like family protein [Candidatus Riflebacteria bacterium]
MAVVTIFSASYCSGQQIARGVAQKLGYRFVDEQFLEDVSSTSGVPADRLRRAMYGPPGFFEGFTRDRVKNVARIREAFAQLIAGDNLVYLGFAGQLIPRTVTHALKVCLIANRDHRIQRASQTSGVPPEQAVEVIRKDDEQCLQWTRYLFEVASWDESLYD